MRTKELHPGVAAGLVVPYCSGDDLEDELHSVCVDGLNCAAQTQCEDMTLSVTVRYVWSRGLYSSVYT